MSATDELRRLLDERGVEWTSGCTEVSRNICTDFCPDTGISISVWESGDGKLGIDAHTNYLLTPEQAIAATLGAGTCKLVETEHEQEIADEFGKGTFSYWAYDCSECGYENAQYGRFCAGCGRKVVDE